MRTLLVVASLVAGCGRIGFDATGETSPDTPAYASKCESVTQSTNVIERDVGLGTSGDVTLPTCSDNQLLAVFSFSQTCTLQVTVTADFDTAVNVIGERCVDNP